MAIEDRPGTNLGWCHRSQARPGEVTLAVGREPSPRTSTTRHLFSRLRVLLVRLPSSRIPAWATTLRLEIRSFYRRILYIREKDLVRRYEMGQACQSCRRNKTPQWCRHIQLCNDHIQQLLNQHPWLSYVDRTLLVEGWNLASQLMPCSLDCGILPAPAGDSAVSAFPGSTLVRSPSGNFMPPLSVQQATVEDSCQNTGSIPNSCIS